MMRVIIGYIRVVMLIKNQMDELSLAADVKCQTDQNTQLDPQSLHLSFPEVVDTIKAKR